ncbi:hypothetical protein EDF68_103321 [Ochrobactrum sp. BH3]|nr:hypothetical protein EDF68_103321 [Ochrobactrum sp. BH3]
MPVRRKASRRRTAFLFEEWEEYLSTGIDIFSDLHHAGITFNHEQPPRELVADAWRALGARVIEIHGTDCWGAGEFNNAGS